MGTAGSIDPLSRDPFQGPKGKAEGFVEEDFFSYSKGTSYDIRDCGRARGILNSTPDLNPKP